MPGIPSLQLIISSGPENAPQAVLGFASAVAAVASGTSVIVFLAMGAAHWADPSEGRNPTVPGFQPVSEMLDFILAEGGRVEVCSSCLGNYCDGTREKTLRTGISPGGLSTVVSRMTEIPTVTF